MKILEQYVGIDFSISENGDGTCSWELHPPAGLLLPKMGAGRVKGGQNDAILAARKAIGVYLDQKAHLGPRISA